MGRKTSPTLTDGELRLMNVLWDRGEATVLDIQQAMDEDLMDSTIRTLLGILEQKGQVARSKQGRAFVYRPRIDREESRRSVVRHVVHRFFGRPADLLLNLIDQEELTPAELKKVKAALRAREKRL